MPCLEISTNIPKEKVTSDIILSLSKEIAACLGKPEQYVAVRILPDQLMSFGGTLEPCGTAQLLSIGKLGVAENKDVHHICGCSFFQYWLQRNNIPSDLGALICLMVSLKIL
ncbi:macrophage migration inhibitory factor-like isoform X2 [Macrobrachium rosenbergii]|uniref:macrophage migration inhibitory factor-like isoform X2 n=1 Tax=Macrobrachium rosenbergii TaxID=79674 RepID=UPI0034D6BD58